MGKLGTETLLWKHCFPQRFPICTRMKHLLQKHFLFPRNKLKCFWFFSETFSFGNKCFPACLPGLKPECICLHWNVSQFARWGNIMFPHSFPLISVLKKHCGKQCTCTIFPICRGLEAHFLYSTISNYKNCLSGQKYWVEEMTVTPSILFKDSSTSC